MAPRNFKLEFLLFLKVTTPRVPITMDALSGCTSRFNGRWKFYIHHGGERCPQSVHANVEVRHCEVGRSGSLIIFIPKGKVHFVDTSAERIHPNGISPLRGLVRRADLSLRDSSTSWIGPQSGYIPTGLVHFVDWSAQRIHPNGISAKK